MLYIITKGDYELTNKLLENFSSNKDITVIKTKELAEYKTYIQNIVSKFFYVFHIPCFINFSKKNKHLFKKLTSTDSILIWDILSPVILYHFAHLAKQARKNIWIWNSFFTFNADSIRIQKLKKYYSIYTFDKMDADKYKFQFKNQLCYNQILTNTQANKNECDIYFVGRDKGRYKYIKELYDKFSKYAKCNFNIIKDNSTPENTSSLLFSQKIDFFTNISNIYSSKAILEVTQSNQGGVTMRILEALISKHKVITNNKNIEREAFYSPKNIFIIDKDNETGLPVFINSEFDDFYDFKHYLSTEWIKNFY